MQPEGRAPQAVSSAGRASGGPDGSAPKAGGSVGSGPLFGWQASSVERPASTAGGRRESSEPLVSITLSRNQVDHVMRAALGEGVAPSVSALVAGTGFHRSDARQMLSARYRDLQDNRRLSRSLLAGLLVLSCFPPEGVDMGIKDISEQLDLNTSTVHRYVLTLVAAGLLERDPDTRRYRLLPE
jgi:hypothetical protein